MVRAVWWFAVALALIVSAGARAQYYGYLPVQTGGSEQVTATIRSNTWGLYTFKQRDMDTVLVGYPPNIREVQVVDTTCWALYDRGRSRPYWWVGGEPRISLIEVTPDGTYRYRLEALARTTSSTMVFHDYIVLYNARADLDIYKDQPLGFQQTVYVEAVPPPEP